VSAGKPSRRLLAAFGAATLAVAIAAPTAGAAATRAEYVAEADPICKRAQKAANRVFSKLGRRNVKEIASGRDPEKFLRVFAKLTGRANKPFGRMVKSLYEIQPPPGDEISVSQWLDGLGDYKRLIDRSVRATFRGKIGRAFQFELDAANALFGGARFVNGFDFEHCPGGKVVTGPGQF
jgi:hypothetical protein